MKLLRYKGALPGPTMTSPLLSATYDFTSGACEVSDWDVAILLVRCSTLFEDVTNKAVMDYMVARQTDVAVPVLASAVVIGNKLTLTYTDANNLNSTETAVKTDFAVTKGGTANPVTAVRVAGKTVVLTLTTAAVAGDTVLVSYTRQVSGAKQIKDVKGNLAANLSSQAVTNSTPDVAAPVLSTAVITGASLVLTFTDASVLDGDNTAAADDFSVTIAGVAATVSGVAVHAANKTYTLTVDPAATNGDVVTVSYVKPETGVDVIQDAAGNATPSFTDEEVTNSTI